MNAEVKADMINIEVDGQALQVPKGAMIIEATDKAGIDIPRFCYHKKLSIAANCRMCLVDVEKAPKPLPACATPVMDGMKVYTESRRARDAQQGVMEFLLINHPLDCPICDQGGECELQDLAMGYGRSVSRFTERKRSVKDKNIGPLVSTDMTRCIHCTRCVRFLDEIAGTNELGGIGRGENTEISTFVERSVDSELSGNIIDLCPVGALTNKPFRFSARAWELTARPAVATHDSLGSNVWYHVRRGEIMRTVPRDNETVNESWLADRDRYSHFGWQHDARLTAPMIKHNQDWSECDWEQALRATTEMLKGRAADQVAILASSQASTEDHFSLVQFAASLGGATVDHRLRTLDADDTGIAHCSIPLSSLSSTDAALVVGSHLSHEQPLLAQRLRQAKRQNGATIHSLNAVAYDWHFETKHTLLAGPQNWLPELGGLLLAAYKLSGQTVSDDALGQWLTTIESNEQQQQLVQSLLDAERPVLMFGAQAAMHPDAGLLRQVFRRLASLCDAQRIELDYGANSYGANLVGARPISGGLLIDEIAQKNKQILILHDIDPVLDSANPELILEACRQADHVIAINSFASDSLRALADIVLPLASMVETGGTLYNVEGLQQRFAASIKPVGEARPLWKMLRMLSEQLELNGCDWLTTNELQQQMDVQLAEQALTVEQQSDWRTPSLNTDGIHRLGEVPMYSVDAVCRYSSPLQQTSQAKDINKARVHPDTAKQLKLKEGDAMNVDASDASSVEVLLDNSVAVDTVLLSSATDISAQLGAAISPLSISKQPAGEAK